MSRARLAPPAALLAAIASLLPACSSSDGATETDAGAVATAPPHGFGDGGPLDSVLGLHHVQAKGTHNSYHVESPGSTEPSWHYTQPPLDVQLDQLGVRQVELDLHLAPGASDFEVFHLQYLDEGTTCRKLVECLGIVEAWSRAHPSHHAIYVQLEPKAGFTGEDPEGFIAKLEAQILSVFPRDRIITPDEVRGGYATLGAAVAAEGWPTLGQTRGRVFFGLDDRDHVRDALTRAGTSLDGRLIFPDVSPGDRFAALTMHDDPAPSLAANMLVREFSDSAGSGDEANAAGLAAALASGAQWISGDFPGPVDGSTYHSEIPGGTPSRCSPVTAPETCTPEAIDKLR